ncbi:3-hydroxyacyl-CoA dehydrogenase NAD-binding domain-containing protein [Sphingomonas hengshuiensis]|uniref:3-hydroxyacyl-CoA dehydrogenase n=1 Tax=Sphingomonas hengshuiensis TaxID=1609977 RepID=A0A7U5BF15_9SPHN|nr:3-hydroxyacyl-CoA dehydrogenase NAD-binding domain-containing protein [Sphingomonas hengshuiensis]AJP74078.1 hypothetical protein TS85_23200 [Sphingomonas hengshuiensis]
MAPPIACVGSGLVGRSWAIVFARAGYRVQIWDSVSSALDKTLPALCATLNELEKAGAIASASEIAGRITLADSLADAIADSCHVQESVSERLEIKRALFAEMDDIAPARATLGSSTSAIPGSAYMTGLAGSRRCLVVHPVNPPHLIPLVELCPTQETDAETVDRVAALMREVGQKPIILAREIEGFALNRLQWALLCEAMHLIGEGYCTPQDIDAVMTHGLARRWAHLGPLAVGHLNAATGFQGYFDGLGEAIGRVRATLRTDYIPSTETVAKTHAAMDATMPVSDLPRYQAKRDRAILALDRLLRDPG